MKISVQPNARKNEIVGVHGDAIKIKVAAVPEDGKANAELCAFVAAKLGLAKSKVNVIKGQTSRDKVIAAEGFSESEIRAKLIPQS